MAHKVHQPFLLSLLLVGFFTLMSHIAYAEDTQLPPGPSAPPARKNPAPSNDPKKKKEKTKSTWQRFVDGVGDAVPTPVRKTWRRTKRNWERTVAVVEAMRKLVGEDKEEKRKRLAREKKQAKLDAWQSEDQAIEKRIREKLELTIHQQSCMGGSATACLAWAKARPKIVTPWRQLRDIWSRRGHWDKLYPVCGILRQRQDQEIEDHLCFAKSLAALKLQKEATQIYAELLQKYPKHPSLLLDAGNHALQQQDFALAIERCKQLTQLLPEETDAWYCLAQTQETIRITDAQRTKDRLAALQAKKNPPKPTKDPKQAVPSGAPPKAAKPPQRPKAPLKPLPPIPTADTVLNTYHTACKLGHPKACNDVLRLRPSGASGVLWWSTTVTRISARNVSSTTLQQSCRLMGLSSACRQLALDALQQAQRNERLQRWGQAAWLYEQATQLAPKDTTIWKKAGDFFYQQKLWQRACDALERSLALQPNQPALWYKLGTCRTFTAQSTLQGSQDAYKQACAHGIYKACKKIKSP
ncbi:MAG: hypothetical protein H6728_11375 [Myxococcales bacterium]|nr:hypothetical protein [Myxococcales bacterium]